MAEMLKPLFDLSQADLNAEVESYVPGTLQDENGVERRLAWADLFPLKYTSRFDFKSLAGKEGIPISADRIAFNVKAKTKTRKKIGAFQGELGKIAISRDKDEKEINEYRDAQAIVAATPTDRAAKQELVDITFDDPRFCDRGMNTKIEIDSMYIASHGVQDFPAEIDGDNATQDQIDFNIPTENFKGVSAANKKWSVAATADGIKDIVDLAKALKRAKKLKPNYVFMEQQAFEYLCAQEATLSRLSSYSLFQNANIVLKAEDVNLININRYMASKGYPKIVVLDIEAGVEYDSGDQAAIKPFAENVVLLSPTKQLGWTYYKTVPLVDNTEALQSYSDFYKMTRYSEVNPMKEVTLAEAYVQCVPINRNSIGFINTENTSWNGGAASV